MYQLPKSEPIHKSANSRGMWMSFRDLHIGEFMRRRKIMSAMKVSSETVKFVKELVIYLSFNETVLVWVEFWVGANYQCILCVCVWVSLSLSIYIYNCFIDVCTEWVWCALSHKEAPAWSDSWPYCGKCWHLVTTKLKLVNGIHSPGHGTPSIQFLFIMLY